MSVLQLSRVRKEFEGHVAVDDVSFEVPKGIIFGLLGPNGAGKTTLIRMITGITQTDRGEIRMNGSIINGVLNRDIGYLPEERGLYRKMTVADQLVYLARLKGLSRKEAVSRLKMWLKKFGMMEWSTNKIDELSKGMQQKIQFIATVVHDPALLILDEPFTGLDPVNTNLIKEEIRKLRERGRSIIFSTHRMEQVEEICEQIVLVHQGRNILSGRVDDIKENNKLNHYVVRFYSEPRDVHSRSFDILEMNGSQWLIKLHEGADTNVVLGEFLAQGARIRHFEEKLPTLNEIFIQTVA
ncbi:MAG: ATP-binding cassette domain-containing protein [Saprospiraceae bacterium]|nr:ATP-binding cassette domain-containing protein [Saprospiraceae bacterium]